MMYGCCQDSFGHNLCVCIKQTSRTYEARHPEQAKRGNKQGLAERQHPATFFCICRCQPLNKDT